MLSLNDNRLVHFGFQNEKRNVSVIHKFTYFVQAFNSKSSSTNASFNASPISVASYLEGFSIFFISGRFNITFHPVK